MICRNLTAVTLTKLSEEATDFDTIYSLDSFRLELAHDTRNTTNMNSSTAATNCEL
jgi:hypothetical protein